jgi:hypothetical protein
VGGTSRIPSRGGRRRGSLKADLAARPSLFDEEGQILCPVLGVYTAGIDHVSQIIFRISQYKRCVIDSITASGMWRFVGRSDECRTLGSSDRGLTTCQADKTFIEIIQPDTKYGGFIPGRIGGDKNYLDLVPDDLAQNLTGSLVPRRNNRVRGAVSMA